MSRNLNGIKVVSKLQWGHCEWTKAAFDAFVSLKNTVELLGTQKVSVYELGFTKVIWTLRASHKPELTATGQRKPQKCVSLLAEALSETPYWLWRTGGEEITKREIASSSQIKWDCLTKPSNEQELILIINTYIWTHEPLLGDSAVTSIWSVYSLFLDHFITITWQV